MFLVTDCVGCLCCSFQKGFHLFRGGVLCGVAIGLSDLSHGTRLLLCGGRGQGMGDLGSLFGFYWGFSRASKILLVDMLCSSFKWLCLVNSE